MWAVRLCTNEISVPNWGAGYIMAVKQLLFIVVFLLVTVMYLPGMIQHQSPLL